MHDNGNRLHILNEVTKKKKLLFLSIRYSEI